MYGKKHWFFPDAELPPKGAGGELFGHESIIVLNPNAQDAEVKMTLHWTDRKPSEPAAFTVAAGRVRCIRCVEGEGILGSEVPLGVQYAVSLHSDVPIIAQYGRLDMRTGNMAFYTTPGYSE
ncbi:MAG: hypothetical protein IKR85_01505 [Clostridia bacterium]|nr:hypothetical protein [Clostridia bacterium]